MLKKITIGAIAGIISGLFSAGGGLIVVPSLIHIFKMKDNEARATTVFAILPMVVVSGIFYLNNNFIDWTLGIKVAIGGIVRRNNWFKTTKKTTRIHLRTIFHSLPSICRL